MAGGARRLRFRFPDLGFGRQTTFCLGARGPNPSTEVSRSRNYPPFGSRTFVFATFKRSTQLLGDGRALQVCEDNGEKCGLAGTRP